MENPHHSLRFNFSSPTTDSEKCKLQCEDQTFYYNESKILQMLHKLYEPHRYVFFYIAYYFTLLW